MPVLAGLETEQRQVTSTGGDERGQDRDHGGDRRRPFFGLTQASVVPDSLMSWATVGLQRRALPVRVIRLDRPGLHRGADCLTH
jgi:hypothetical protein